MSTSKQEESGEAKKEKKAPQKDILEILERQQTMMESINQRLARLEKKPIEKPESFAPTQDEGVPEEVSKAFREVLGNRIELRAEKTPGQLGFNLVSIIPDEFHTQREQDRLKGQREDLIKDKDGKVVDRKFVEFVMEDKRSIQVPPIGGAELVKKWAEKIADKIRYEFDKSKLPEPNFFKD